MKKIFLLTILLINIFIGCNRIIHNQNSITVIPKFEYEDNCGSPIYESMVWTIVKGKVTKIINLNTLQLKLETKEVKLVSLVAIEALSINSMDEDTSFTILSKLVLNKEIEVWVNPSLLHENYWNKCVGVVHCNGKDINRSLITSGLVRYKEPEPYSVSDYTACVYRILERKAKENRVGLWKYILH